MRRFLLLLVSGLFCTTRAARTAAAAVPFAPGASYGLKGDIEQVAELARRAFHAPSLALGVTHAGKPFVLEGFPLADNRTNADTVFAIASCTKAFTSCALAKASEDYPAEDEFDLWHTPLQDLNMAAPLQNDCSAALLTPLDMVTHRSGMPGYDGLWYDSVGLDIGQIFARLRYLPPLSPGAFRARFEYNNIMVASAGGLVLDAAVKASGRQPAGTTYSGFVRKHFVEPLGMRRTSFSITDLPTENVALPYEIVPKTKDTVREIPRKNVDNIQAAGGINSCVRDMANWTLMHLSKGVSPVKPFPRLLSEQQIEFVHTPWMHMRHNFSFNSWFPFLKVMGYGGGWAISNYDGHRVILHPGNINGFSSLTLLLPDDDISVVVLCNLDGTYLPFAVAWSTVDLMLFGKLTRDWVDFYVQKTNRNAVDAAASWAEVVKQRKPDAPPSHSHLDSYAGVYSQGAFGEYKVSVDGTALALEYYGKKEALVHWQYDVFAVVGFESAQFFSFQTDQITGKITALTTEVGAPSPTLFARV